MPIPINEGDVQDPKYHPAPGRYIETGGPYPAIVLDADEQVSEAGNPMAVMTLGVVPHDPKDAPEGPAKIRHFLLFGKAQWKLGQWFTAMGEDASNPPKEFDANAYIGRWCQVKVGPGKPKQDGSAYLEIKGLDKLVGEPPEIKFRVTKPQPAPVEPNPEGELPF